MMCHYQVMLNCRGLPDADEAFRRPEAARAIRMFLVPDGAGMMTDAQIPEHLVSDPMIDRYLSITPPSIRTPSEYDDIIEVIERSYVLGMYFPALSAAVVTIERLLNGARIALHPHVRPKIKNLWGKGALDSWEENIQALQTWQYLDDKLAQELRELYGVRCRYLHSGSIGGMEADALRAVKGAYALLECLLGFPPRLFQHVADGIQCLNPEDALVRAFYQPVHGECGHGG